jgi:enamine deaminase RidA (YjgF/YER057c/UK114 family)
MGPLTCAAQEHKAINVSSNRNLRFSDGIVAGNTLYVAGQAGTDDQSKLVAGGISAEAKAALISRRSSRLGDLK